MGREGEFAESMMALADHGIDFQVFAKEALRDYLGDSPSEVLAVCLGKTAMRRPEVFAKSLGTIFGSGSEVILKELELKSRESIAKPVQSRPVHEELASEMTGGGGARMATVNLHDHRIRDEWDYMLERRRSEGATREHHTQSERIIGSRREEDVESRYRFHRIFTHQVWLDGQMD